MPNSTFSFLPDFSAKLDISSSWQHRIGLLSIIFVGFLLRWYSLYEGHAYIYFAINDEISALHYAFGLMAGNPHMFYLGQPALSQGQYPGPLWAMFLAAIYKLGGSSIEGAMFGMLLLNTAVIYLVYLLAARMVPLRYALFTALFYSLSPWAIFYAAGIYNPMPMAFLGALLFLALWQTLSVENSRAIFWVMLLAAAAPQFHMIAVFYYPAILLLLFISPTRLNLRWLLSGATIGLLFYLPYLAGEISHHWQNLHKVLSGSEKFSFGILKILTIPIGMLTNHPGEWPGYHTSELLDFANKWFGSYLVLVAINIISIVLAFLFVFGFVRTSYLSVRSAGLNLKAAIASDRAQLFLAILLILPLLIYILTGKAYATRYSIFIFPLLFILPARYLATIRSGRYKHVLLYSLSVMFIVNIYLVISFYLDLNRKIATAPRFMPAFYKLEAVRSALRQRAGNNSIIVDTSKYIDKRNKYTVIAGSAITEYIALFQRQTPGKAAPQTPSQFSLIGSRAAVPPHADIVYRDNGIIIYQDSPRRP